MSRSTARSQFVTVRAVSATCLVFWTSAQYNCAVFKSASTFGGSELMSSFVAFGRTDVLYIL